MQRRSAFLQRSIACFLTAHFAPFVVQKYTEFRQKPAKCPHPCFAHTVSRDIVKKTYIFYRLRSFFRDRLPPFDLRLSGLSLSHRNAAQIAETGSGRTQMETIMFVKSTLATLALTLAVPFAGAAYAGNDQLANIAGVEPGIYTTAELIQIDDAKKSNDTELLNYIISGENRVSRNATTSSVNAGVAQLAAIAGVSPEGYSASDLQLLIDAQRANDAEAVAFRKAHAAGTITARATSDVTPGKVQLAALVNADPATTSVAELVAAYEDARP